MKITRRQLRQIIKEELTETSVRPGNPLWRGDLTDDQYNELVDHYLSDPADSEMPPEVVLNPKIVAARREVFRKKIIACAEMMNDAPGDGNWKSPVDLKDPEYIAAADQILDYEESYPEGEGAPESEKRNQRRLGRDASRRIGQQMYDYQDYWERFTEVSSHAGCPIGVMLAIKAGTHHSNIDAAIDIFEKEWRKYKSVNFTADGKFQDPYEHGSGRYNKIGDRHGREAIGRHLDKYTGRGKISESWLKITRTRLRQIIKEEIENTLEENVPVPVGDSMSRGRRFYSAAEKSQIRNFKLFNSRKSNKQLEMALSQSRNELERYAINSLLADRSFSGEDVVDTDGDGTPDYRDSDSDNDGIPDSVESRSDSSSRDRKSRRNQDEDLGPPA